MRIPSFIKAIIGCTDRESSRYALGAVKLENADGVSHAIATDGRLLVDVSWGERLDAPVEAMVEGDSLKKAFTAAHAKRGRPTTLEFTDPTTAMVEGAAGKGIAKVLTEGRYPRWRDVFPSFPDDGASRFQIHLKPALVSTLMALYEAAGVETVQFWFDDAQSAVLMAAVAPTGEVIRTVLMPCSSDGAKREFPDAATAAPLPQPEPVAVAC